MCLAYSSSMNPFVIQNCSSTKGHRFHNKPLVPYPQLMQNGHISSVGGNKMLRYPNQIVGSYNVAQQNFKSLPENHHLQFGRAGSRLFNYVGVSNGSNPIGHYFSHPVNVFNGKGKGLVEFPRRTNLVISKNPLTRNMHLSPPKAESLVKNFTKISYGPNTNHMRLLDVFNKNFNLSRPTTFDAHDRKRKKIALNEGVMQNSYSLLNGKGNKRNKPTCKVQKEPEKYVNNPSIVKKEKDQAKSKVVIQEDENSLLKVCSEPLLENKRLRKDSAGISIRGKNTKACSVDDASEPAGLDLTLHL